MASYPLRPTPSISRNNPSLEFGAIKSLLGVLIAAATAGFAFWQADGFGLFAGEKTALGDAAELQPEAPAVRVLVQPVRMTADERVFEAVGTARSLQSITVYSPVAEEVTSVLVASGDKVEAGQLLFQLEDRQERLAMRLAEVTLRDAERLLERYEKASREGAVPESEVDAARADFESAEVQLSQARLDLEDRQVRAPFAGVVGIPRVDAGDRVGPDTALVTLDDRSILHVDYEIPEQLLRALAARDSVEVLATTPAYPGREFQGVLSAAESRLDAARRTLTLRASFDNGEDLLRPGMSFTIRWRIPGETYPTVPEIALQWGRQGAFVWAVRDGAAERIMTRVVARRAGMVLLDGDLREDEPVVVEGVQRLRPGVAVDILGTLGGGAVLARSEAS